MKTLYALICENASERNDGRLDVHGVFHQLFAPGFPAQQDTLTLAVAIEWEPHERGSIQFSIELVDPDNAPVLSISGQTEVSDMGSMSGPPQTRIVMPLNDVVFPSEGTFAFELKVGETREHLAPLHLIATGPVN